MTAPGMTRPLLLAGAAVSLFLPAVLPAHDLRVLISALAVIGPCVAFGWAGLIQLGQVAFVGIGACTSVILARDHGFGFPAALLGAVAVTGLLAVLIGVPMLMLAYALCGV